MRRAADTLSANAPCRCWGFEVIGVAIHARSLGGEPGEARETGWVNTNAIILRPL
jgi:hypothetical protein